MSLGYIRRVWGDAMKTINGTYRFDYPAVFVTLPDYTAHAGQTVTVLGVEEWNEAGDDVEQLYKVRAADGWEGVAWESELQETK